MVEKKMDKNKRGKERRIDRTKRYRRMDKGKK
jgi:hypothetical protein